LLEVALGLARKADDERRPEDDAGNGVPDARDEIPQPAARPGTAAPHAFEHAVARVLERHVEVRADARLARDQPEEAVGHVLRVQIEEAEPRDAVDFEERLEEALEVGAVVAVVAVARQVMRDERQLLDAAVGEAARLRDERGDAPALLPTADLGNDAEGARAVAALGDLEERRVE